MWPCSIPLLPTLLSAVFLDSHCTLELSNAAKAAAAIPRPPSSISWFLHSQPQSLLVMYDLRNAHLDFLKGLHPGIQHSCRAMFKRQAAQWYLCNRSPCLKLTPNTACKVPGERPWRPEQYGPFLKSYSPHEELSASYEQNSSLSKNTHFYVIEKFKRKNRSYCYRILHISYSRGKFTEVELRAVHQRMDQVSTVPASFNTSLFPLFIIGKDSSMVFSCSNSLVR